MKKIELRVDQLKKIFKKDKKDLPLISVITVVLNNKKFLQKSINSVLSQTYKNYELIIIDGNHQMAH